MCGVSGLLTVGGTSTVDALGAIATRMTETLRHRGPDAGDVWIDAAAGIALGHRRLAIIDLSPQGLQPMHSACGRYVISFNGEVYNFRALRHELEPRGHSFRGHSDTEVMLAAIREWGIGEAVRRFVGMFAFALWDRRERRLSLVRDRLGIKPLYYGWAGETLLFASELKAIRAYPDCHASIDRHALTAFMRYGYVPSPLTIYDGFYKLPAGSMLHVHCGSRGVSPEAYWSARNVARQGQNEPLQASPEEATELLDQKLREAVSLRLESDVPLGAFLSGGIDSSTVVALMQAQSTRPIKTFTVGFNEARYDEANHARAVATHLGTEHTELYVQPSDALSLIPQIPEWYDEPFADSSQLPTYLVSQMTRRHVTVSLSGDGGDELFAGYDRYFWTESIWRVTGRLSKSVRSALANLLLRLPAERIDRFAGLLPARLTPRMPGDRAQKLALILYFDEIDAVYHQLQSLCPSPKELVIEGQEPRGPFDDPTLAKDLLTFIPRAQYLDLVTYLPDDILTKLDRASMAVSLEARVPLLDHRVVELSWQMPLSLKIRHGRRKWILRQVLYRYVPHRLVERPKMGFGVPIDSWLRGPLREWAEDLLDETRLAGDGFLNAKVVRTAWREHLSGHRNRHYQLWNVLMFQAWKARWAA
jgi:asparagine synthase (glutamine-hydrolysing)